MAIKRITVESLGLYSPSVFAIKRRKKVCKVTINGIAHPKDHKLHLQSFGWMHRQFNDNDNKVQMIITKESAQSIYATVFLDGENISIKYNKLFDDHTR